MVLQRVESSKRDELRLRELLAQHAKEARNASLRYEIGTIYLRKQSDSDALHWFSAALQIDPNHRPTHAALADYYQRKGDAETSALHRRRAAGAE
jgi:Tfp pilus assembly protein PilF